MSRKIKFVKNDDDMVYNPDKSISTFYQFCQFKNPYTGKYWSRKIFFNEHGTILKLSEREYSKNKIEEYAKNHKENKFKMYPSSDIKFIALPNGNDMTEAQSELLNNKCKEYDNMQVNFDD